MAVAAKDCHELTSYYVKIYKQAYGTAPTVNRTTARWDWAGILEDLSKEEVKVLIDYYFSTKVKGHPLAWFFYNYDKLLLLIKEQDEDAQRRKRLREESELRAKEWRESGKRGISSN